MKTTKQKTWRRRESKPLLPRRPNGRKAPTGRNHKARSSAPVVAERHLTKDRSNRSKPRSVRSATATSRNVSLLTVTEAARRLGMPLHKLFREIHVGDLIGRQGPMGIYVRESELREFLRVKEVRRG